MDVVCAPQREVQHPAGHRGVGELVDQDEAPELAVRTRSLHRIRLEHDLAVGCDLRNPNCIQAERRRCEMLERVDVDLIFGMLDAGPDGLRAELQPVAAARNQLVLVHPHNRRFELVGHLGRVAGRGDHVAPRAVDLVREGQGNRLPRDRLRKIAVGGDDPFDARQTA